MKKMVLVAVLMISLVMMGHTTKAQGKIAYVSLQELIPSMPGSEKPLYAFQRVMIYGVKRPGAVGGPSIISQVEVIILWQTCRDLFQNGQSAVP